MDSGTSRPTERSEGGSTSRRTRGRVYDQHVRIRLDAHTLQLLEKDADENHRTLSQSIRHACFLYLHTPNDNDQALNAEP